MQTALVDPEEVGVDPARLDVLVRRVALEVEHGPLPAAQLAVAARGRLVANHTFGTIRPGQRFILQSVGRTLLASCAWKLMDEDLLHPQDRVADVVEEFGTNGKEAVTVEQVLTHTAGFPFAPLGLPAMESREGRLAAFAKWRLTYEPGTLLQFHLTSAAWLIAEFVERLTGLPLPVYLREVITEPLGLTSVQLAVPQADQAASIAPMTVTDSTDPNPQVDPWGPWYLNNPRIIAAGEPSHCIVASAADVALHYQALACSGLWSRSTIEDATRIRVSMPPEGDQLYGGGSVPVNMGLFVTVAGDTGGNWLPVTGSSRLFGHGGAASQLGFYDPETEVSVAFLTNGYPLAGYDYTRAGIARVTNIGNLGADLAAD
jgi:CubicO group peptidase (beta-lactamase class C family)